jgi:hypothetical protein
MIFFKAEDNGMMIREKRAACSRVIQKGICRSAVCLLVLKTMVCLAQDTFHFQVSMKKAHACGLLAPDEKDRVIMRGSFNNWAGDDFELEDRDHDGIFERTFVISPDSGTAPEYKYLIIKSNGKELWEKYPNPDNTPYGNRFLDATKNQPDDFDIDPYHLGLIGKSVIFPVDEIRDDFIQFRNTLETQHCCLYEYTKKAVFDSLFDSRYQLLNRPMSPGEFYKILTPVTANIGCGHTAVWMPGAYWNCGENRLFPLKIRLIEDQVIVAGSYTDSCAVQSGSVLQEINGVPVSDIIQEMQANYSADAMNIHFIDSQIERRFSMIYARRLGFKDQFHIKFTPPGQTVSATVTLKPVSVSAVRAVVFSNFNHPALQMKIADEETAVMTIPTFIYYERVPYFTHFIDSCFAVIHDSGIKNLILDLRGNDGGDPFCAAPLFSYLQAKPEPYFAEPYGKYSELAKPIPLPDNHFTGQLYTLIDGRCFSTNGHFCALLKYHHIGKFVGTESGATYMCNAGKNTEIRLNHTDIILNFGRSTYAAAVQGMDKTKPIMPDYYVEETLSDFIDGKDTQMEFVFKLIKQ